MDYRGTVSWLNVSEENQGRNSTVFYFFLDNVPARRMKARPHFTF